MPYYSPAQERPRQAKKFITVREVEDMAAAGATEIIHVEGLVITDAAREAAHDLGLRIRLPDPQTSISQPSARQPQPPINHALVEGPGAAQHPEPPSVPDAGHRLASVQGQGGLHDPLVRAIVQAARANPRISAAMLRKG